MTTFASKSFSTSTGASSAAAVVIEETEAKKSFFGRLAKV